MERDQNAGALDSSNVIPTLTNNDLSDITPEEYIQKQVRNNRPKSEKMIGKRYYKKNATALEPAILAKPKSPTIDKPFLP